MSAPAIGDREGTTINANDFVPHSKNLIKQLKESLSTEQDEASFTELCGQLLELCDTTHTRKFYSLLQDLLIAYRGGYVKAIPLIFQDIDSELLRLSQIAKRIDKHKVRHDGRRRNIES